jgi:hypothetical protein
LEKLAFIFKKWENRVPYYALMKLDEEKICALEVTYGAARQKGVRTALVATFGDGWSSVVKKAGKQTLKYGGRKTLGCITGIICGYFGSASIVLITKSHKIVKCAKICHSACSGVLDVAELCASAPINILEIGIFGRPVVIEGEGFDLFSNNPDPLDDVEKLLKK